MSNDLRSAELLHTIAEALGVTPDVFLSRDRRGLARGERTGEDTARRDDLAGASRLLQLYRDLPDQDRRERALRLVEALLDSDAT